MNKMNSVWEKSGALFLLYSQKGNVIMFLGLRNAPMALKVGSVQDCGKSFAVPQQKNVLNFNTNNNEYKIFHK